VLTGGQDDLVTIVSPWEQRVVARCQGHASFVAALAFDDALCDGRTYRFGSVGEDNRLILVCAPATAPLPLELMHSQWDFSAGALHRPKLPAHAARPSMASSLSLAPRRGAGASVLALAPVPGADSRFHPAPGRTEVAVVQPVLVRV
jgi:hypothetical protein